MTWKFSLRKMLLMQCHLLWSYLLIFGDVVIWWANIKLSIECNETWKFPYTMEYDICQLLLH